MKILFVLNSGFDIPGPSNHLLESIIEKHLLQGDKVHIIEKYSSGQNPAMPIYLSKFNNLTYDICNVKNIKKMNFIRRYFEDFKYSISCLKYFKNKRNVDAIFLQSCNTSFFHILFLKLLINKPVIYNVQDIFPNNARMIGMLNEKNISYKLLRLLQRTAYRMSDKIITISDDMKKTIINENINSEKIEVIYNWSYSDDIMKINDEKNKFIKDNNIKENYYKVVYAGNIGKLQNIDIIMKAANLLKDEKRIKFYIVGDGVCKEKHIKYAKDNGLKNIIFYPFQNSEYAQHIYSMSDINIIPLQKGVVNTALPSKTATCLAIAKPIIACIDKNSNFSRMIESCDKCTVIDSDDVVGLANCIKDYFQKNVKGYSVGARKLFQNKFSKELNTSRYVNSINETVNKNYF